jgi:DNA-directed RNA polymerase subunit RPC12/RpoP
MSIVKRGEITSSLVVVSFSYVCSKCGATLTVEKDLINNKCKKCKDGIMMLASAETKVKEE